MKAPHNSIRFIIPSAFLLLVVCAYLWPSRPRPETTSYSLDAFNGWTTQQAVKRNGKELVESQLQFIESMYRTGSERILVIEKLLEEIIAENSDLMEEHPSLLIDFYSLMLVLNDDERDREKMSGTLDKLAKIYMGLDEDDLKEINSHHIRGPRLVKHLEEKLSGAGSQNGNGGADSLNELFFLQRMYSLKGNSQNQLGLLYRILEIYRSYPLNQYTDQDYERLSESLTSVKEIINGIRSRITYEPKIMENWETYIKLSESKYGEEADEMEEKRLNYIHFLMLNLHANYAEVRGQCVKLLSVYERKFGPTSVQNLKVLGLLATVMEKAFDEKGEVIKIQKRILAIQEAQEKTDHEARVKTLLKLAEAYTYNKDLENAKLHYLKSIEIAEIEYRTKGKLAELLKSSYSGIANFFLDNGDMPNYKHYSNLIASIR